jgi:hypothetical protein
LAARSNLGRFDLGWTLVPRSASVGSVLALRSASRWSRQFRTSRRCRTTVATVEFGPTQRTRPSVVTWLAQTRSRGQRTPGLGYVEEIRRRPIHPRVQTSSRGQRTPGLGYVEEMRRRPIHSRVEIRPRRPSISHRARCKRVRPTLVSPVLLGLAILLPG